MNSHRALTRLLAVAAFGLLSHLATAADYPWLSDYAPDNALSQRIATPSGYARTPSDAGSFQDWLRGLPLKPGNPEVRLYDGRLKHSQDVHVAVVDIDVGKRDLQQCADAVMRLRAEYLYASGQYDAIRFHFTSGDEFSFRRWSQGYAPRVAGNRVAWHKGKPPGLSRASFRQYLDIVFTYAGSASLQKEMLPVKNIKDIRVGDVFVQGGFPGHAVIVVDIVQNTAGDKQFLLAQSYMPAQDIHILRNPGKWWDNPWYGSDFGAQLQTPEWTFPANALYRFR